jgi:hypothetical protein
MTLFDNTLSFIINDFHGELRRNPLQVHPPLTQCRKASRGLRLQLLPRVLPPFLGKRSTHLTGMSRLRQVKQLLADKAELTGRLERLEEREDDGSDMTGEKSKRHRRTASEISRHYKCSIVTCQKSYGSEGSLNQHIRLKHP